MTRIPHPAAIHGNGNPSPYGSLPPSRLARRGLDPGGDPLGSPAGTVGPSERIAAKKSIGGGQFGTTGGENAVTSRYLAKHPEFAASCPFDGYGIPAVLPTEWGERLGLSPRAYFLHELL